MADKGRVFGFSGAMVVLAACVGNDPVQSSGPAAAPSSDVPDGGGGPSSTDAAAIPDASPTCGAGLTACAGMCVALDSNADHCDRCGHDCGGGTCMDRVCAPVQLIADFKGSANLAAADGTYFLTENTQVRACTNVGCTKPTVIAGFTQYPLNAGLAAGGGRVIFAASPDNALSQYQGLFSCKQTGCLALPGDVLVSQGKYIAIEGVEMGGAAHDRVVYGVNNNGKKSIGTATCSATSCTTPVVISDVTPAIATELMAVDDANVYFTQVNAGATNLVMCPLAGCPGNVPVVIANLNVGAGTTIAAIRASGGLVYVAVLASNPKVLSCQPKPNGGCGTLATGIASFSAFDLDASGFYYGSEVQGSLESCKLGGCGGGPTKLRPAATPGATYAALRVSDRYIYWIQDVMGTKSVWRLAKR